MDNSKESDQHDNRSQIVDTNLITSGKSKTSPPYTPNGLWDGRLSIEHQLEIHTNDVLHLMGGTSLSSFTNFVKNGPNHGSQKWETSLENEIEEVLTGLRYVLEYRIRGVGSRGEPDNKHHIANSICDLNVGVCERLIRALLMLTGSREKHGMSTTSRFISTLISSSVDHPRHKPSANADMAFVILTDYCLEIPQCFTALTLISTEELRIRLRLGRRILKPTTTVIREAALTLLRLLLSVLMQHGGRELAWKDYFEHPEDVEEIEKEHPELLDIILTPLDLHSIHPVPLDDSTIINLFPPSALYFDRDPSRVLDMFHSNEQMGLSSSETTLSLLKAHYGPNSIPPPRIRPWWRILLGQLFDVMIIILLIATIVAAIVDFPELQSSIILALVVLLNVAVGFWQEYNSSKTIAAMRSLRVPMAKVRRGGTEMNIPADELVPGDIVLLAEGDSVPADLRLIRVSRLHCQESLLTGESKDVTKGIRAIRMPTRKLPLNKCTGNAFMGTVVTRGTGIGVVVRTGLDTEIGKISAALGGISDDEIGGGGQGPESASILRTEMAYLSKTLVIISLFLCGILVIIGVLRGEKFVVMARLAISLAVSVIPEGLLAILTVSMALSVRRLSKKGALVRRLNAIETLGAVSVVAADKTGTLTEGHMKMANLWCYDIKETKDDAIFSNFISSAKEAALKCCILCNNATMTLLEHSNIDTTSVDKDILTGEPTEIALLIGAIESLHIDSSISFATILSDMIKNYPRVLEIPFDSDRKMMTTINRCLENNNESSLDSKSISNGPLMIFCKGAAEAILQRCTHVMCADNGNLIPLLINDITQYDDQRRAIPVNLNSSNVIIDIIAQKEDEYSDQGLRVLALAIRKDLPGDVLYELQQNNDFAKQQQEYDNTVENVKEEEEEEKMLALLTDRVERDLIFVGLVGLIDPPREGTREAIRECHQAGVKVYMITGDNLKTAMSIASKVGIILDHNNNEIDGNNMIQQSSMPSRFIRGRDLDILTEEALTQMAPFPSIFARVSPQNKLTIVKALQKRKECVTMTGDGVNDAPAIRQANVGIAVAITDSKKKKIDIADRALISIPTKKEFLDSGGTDLAREAADILLLQGDLGIITDAILEGRQMYRNVTLFLIYLLSCNSAEIWTILVTVLVGWTPVPLSSMNILWANVIADIPPSLALGLERTPREVLLGLRPEQVVEEPLGKITWLLIGVNGITLAALTLVVFHFKELTPWLEGKIGRGQRGGGGGGNLSEVERRSEAFLILIGLQIFLALFSRSRTASVFRVGLTGNKWLLIAVTLSMALLVGGLYVPWLRELLDLAPVSWIAWSKFGIALAILIIVNELTKAVVRNVTYFSH